MSDGREPTGRATSSRWESRLSAASDGSGSAASSRAVALSSATVDAVETLTTTIASRRRHAAV
ncbi:hypothetical protein [Streptomyces sp. NPDC004008]